MEIAEKMYKKCGSVTMLGRGRLLGGLCREVLERLEMNAVQRGVKFVGSRLLKAAGLRSLEAVVAGGKILPCDALAVVPQFGPDHPLGSPQTGPRGGIAVDNMMRSADSEVFAAGSCAEMATAEYSVPLPLGRSAPASGRVAGANAAGRTVALNLAAPFAAELFGLCIGGAGLTFDLARSAGLEVVETVRADGAASVCSLVHERTTGRIIGGQLAAPQAEGVAGLLASAVSHRVDIGSLAYAVAGGSTDISLLRDTARQGLAWR